MSISEADRHQLVRLLSEAITPKGAALLMEHLPPVGWADVATKRDLDALSALTKRDLDAHAQLFSAALREQGALLRLEMAEMSSSLRAEMAEQGASLRLEIAVLAGRFDATDAKIDASKYEVLATLRQDMLLQTRTFVLANVAGIFTAVGLAFAAAKLA